MRIGVNEVESLQITSACPKGVVYDYLPRVFIYVREGLVGRRTLEDVFIVRFARDWIAHAQDNEEVNYGVGRSGFAFRIYRTVYLSVRILRLGVGSEDFLGLIDQGYRVFCLKHTNVFRAFCCRVVGIT